MAKRESNPFIYSNPVPPAKFIGREQIVARAWDRLSGPHRASIAFSGEHGIGKTSLLYYLIHTAREEAWGQPDSDHIYLYLHCQTVGDFTITTFWRHTLQLLKEAREHGGLHRQIEGLLEKPELDAAHLRGLLQWMGEQGLALILMLDDFTRVMVWYGKDEARVSNFLASLRSLIGSPIHPLTLITATQQPLYVLCAEIVENYPGSHFYNTCEFITLLPFTPNEVEALFAQAFADKSFRFDEADRAFLAEIAGTHPALFQMASSSLFDAHREQLSRKEIPERVVPEFERSARHYFKDFWDESTAIERMVLILTCLLDLSKQTEFQAELKGQEIYHLLQRYDRPLIQLVERGLIQKQDDTFQIFSVVFTWWITHEVGDQADIDLIGLSESTKEDELQWAWRTLNKLAPRLTLRGVTQILLSDRHQPQVAEDDHPTATGTKAPPPEEPRPEQQAAAATARFEMKKLIGQGAFGKVHHAFDHKLNRDVALKILAKSAVVSDEEQREQVLKEARAASQLLHPYIVTIFDVTEIDDQICMVMEYVEGQTLAGLLLEEKRLELPYVAALLEPVAGALDFAHEKGIVHRDIKPANLLKTATGSLMLSDFGLAKIINDPKSIQSTGIKGTLVYMSPEQVNEKQLDGRSDLFSLATVAFEMLSGELPWPSQSLAQIINDIAETPARTLHELQTPDAERLDPIFQKALAKDPADRYQTGKEFVEALKDLI